MTECEGCRILRTQLAIALKKIAELEARLSAYENAHTPSSKKRFSDSKEKSENKNEHHDRGRAPGFEGTTRKQPTPNRFKDLKPSGCSCGSKRVRTIQTYQKIVEDIQIVHTNTRFTWYDCQCEDCGRVFTTTDAELPFEGVFGPNLLSLWNALHYQGVIPFERLAKFSTNCLEVPISTAGMMNAVYRSTQPFESFYQDVQNSFSSANYVRSDESGYPYNDELYWLWNISNQYATLVKIDESRSSQVVQKVVGPNFAGVLNSDCLPTYDNFHAGEKQKCWAHIFREAKYLAEDSLEAKRFFEKLKRIYAYVRKVKECHAEGTPGTLIWVERSIHRIRKWKRRRWRHEKLRKLVKRLARYEKDWFSCLKYDFVEPDNNSSERDIRKNVIARKVSGIHRSKEGLHAREVMMTVFLTLSRRGVNAYSFVQTGLRKYNAAA